ncbi:hypothetical protein RchiOBHm_Chr5g0054331 [Rosa chinensis]|uniref:Uncharacterized protein n=1 Tax=Rosa chinensis TaxID=74649 RepID=A0A2P6QG47_ROSCH|nr:hypothetical protein RchiOBHm_Chr5g0054331 [Rosa chinensis]
MICVTEVTACMQRCTKGYLLDTWPDPSGHVPSLVNGCDGSLGSSFYKRVGVYEKSPSHISSPCLFVLRALAIVDISEVFRSILCSRVALVIWFFTLYLRYMIWRGFVFEMAGREEGETGPPAVRADAGRPSNVAASTGGAGHPPGRSMTKTKLEEFRVNWGVCPNVEFRPLHEGELASDSPCRLDCHA